MNKFLLREYFELCDGGVCQDLLTEADKAFVRSGGIDINPTRASKYELLNSSLIDEFKYFTKTPRQ